MKETLNTDVIKSIEEATRNQNKSSLWYEMRYGRITASKALWYEMRYGRITASKAHEVSVCQTADGSLVAAIMGAKIPDTAAMKRGRRLELLVRKTVSNKLKKKFTPCGLFISQEFPMLAASPDGVCSDAVIEIKCPTSEKTKKNYIKDGQISIKCKAQVQLQMYASGMKKCYFCVADANYEESGNVDIIEITYDPDYVKSLINKLRSVWKCRHY
ncbi:YqaJ-like viral recombinase domain [Popillia japonica]|uniref:YqaJ-like viral recombinase domain n=1 Tax=Popillia japonica TaxID=7064 RepID=A0AAW1LRG0_POPJA